MRPAQDRPEDSKLIDLSELCRKRPDSNLYPQEPKTELLISGELAVRIHNAIKGYHKKYGEESRLPEPAKINHQPFFESIVNRLLENVKEADANQKRVKAFNVRAGEKPFFQHVFDGKNNVWKNLSEQRDLDDRHLKSPLLEELLRRINLQIECIVLNSALGIQKFRGHEKPLKPNEFVMIDKTQLPEFLINRLFKNPKNLYIRESTRYHKVFLATLKNLIAPLLVTHLDFTKAEINLLIEKLEPKFDEFGTIFFYVLVNGLTDFIKERESQAGGKN